MTLSARLREATAAAHQAAERTAFVRRLFTGTLPREGYAALLRALHPVYDALERGMRANLRFPAVAALHDPALERAGPLAEDLAWFAGPDWAARPVVAPARAYAVRLEGLARTRPELLCAHAYVRYLGDLSGGQMLARAVAKHYGATDAGARFYAFPETPDLGRRKDEYRAALDALPLPPADQDALVDEAIAGFDAARAIFEALEAEYPPAPPEAA